MKRVLSIILSICLVVSNVPVTVYAEETDGLGGTDNVILESQVETPEEEFTEEPQEEVEEIVEETEEIAEEPAEETAPVVEDQAPAQAPAVEEEPVGILEDSAPEETPEEEAVTVQEDVVATIGEIGYPSLAAAFEAAKNLIASGNKDITVTLAADIDLQNGWNNNVCGTTGSYSNFAGSSAKFTLDGAGKKITNLNMPLFGRIYGFSEFTIKNITVESSTIVGGNAYNGPYNASAAFIGNIAYINVMNFDNCTVNKCTIGGAGEGNVGGLYCYLEAFSSTVNVTKCNITDNDMSGSNSVGGVAGHAAGASTVINISDTTVTGNRITSTGSSRVKAGSVIGTFGVATVTLDATVSNNTVVSGGEEAPGIYGRYGSNGSALSITGGSYDCGVKVPDASGTLAVSGGTFKEEIPAEYLADGFKLTKNEDGSYGIAVKGPEAKIGDTIYATLQKALNAAPAGSVVTVIDDITLTDTLIVPLKSLTLNVESGKKAIMAGGIKIEQNKDATGLDMTIDGLIIEKNLWLEGYTTSNLSKVANFTVQNCTFQNGSSLRGAGSAYMLDINNTSNGSEPISNLTIKNNTFIGYGADKKISGIWAGVCGTATIESNTLKDIGHHGMAIYANGTLSEGVTLKVNDNELDYGLKGEGGVAIQLDGLNQINGANLDLTGNAFLTDDAAVKILNNSNNIATDVSGCYWNGNDPTDSTTKTIANGGTADINSWCSEYSNGELTGLVQLPAVAKVGSKEYTSVAAALKAATSGQAVELLGDATISDVTANKADLYVADGSTVAFSGNVNGINYVRDALVRDNDQAHTGYTATVESGVFYPYATYLNGGSTLTVNAGATAKAVYWNVYGGTLTMNGSGEVPADTSAGTTYNVTGTVNLNGNAIASLMTVYSAPEGKQAGSVTITGDTSVNNSMQVGGERNGDKYYADGNNSIATLEVDGSNAALHLSRIAGSTFNSTVKSNGVVTVKNGGTIIVGENGPSGSSLVIEAGGKFEINNAKASFVKTGNINWSDSKLVNNGQLKLVLGQDYALEVSQFENKGTVEVDLTNASAGQKVISFIGNADKDTVDFGDLNSYSVTGNTELGITVKNNELVVIDSAATVNGNSYETLKDALQAACSMTGDVTVEINKDIDLGDAAWPELIVDGYTIGTGVVTVNGNNHSITGLTAPLFSSTWAGQSGLIINDLTIIDSTITKETDDATETVGVGAFIGYPSASNPITLKNCKLLDSTVWGGHWTGGLIGTAGGYSGASPVKMNLTIEDCEVSNCTIKGKGSVGAIIGHAANDGNTGVIVQDCVAKNNKITSTGTSKIKAGSVFGTVGAAPVTISVEESGNTVRSGGTLTSGIYGRFGTPGSKLSIVGGSYQSGVKAPEVASSLAVSGGTYTEAIPAEYLVDGFMLTQNADGTYSVEEKPAVAKIGNTEYKKLTDAVNAANDGDTITLLSDCEGDGVALWATDAKNITIDLGGNTYTVSGAAVGSPNYESQGFHFEKGNTVTIKNGTLTSTSADVKMLIQNYSDLTLTDVTVDGSNIPAGNTSRYVVSNNSGNVVLNGKTSIIVPEENGTPKDGYIAMDSCQFGSYDTPTVTVETTGTINGPIEASGGKVNAKAGNFYEITKAAGYNVGDVQVSGGSFKKGVPAEFLAPGIELVQNADGSWSAKTPGGNTPGSGSQSGGGTKPNSGSSTQVSYKATVRLSNDRLTYNKKVQSLPVDRVVATNDKGVRLVNGRDYRVTVQPGKNIGTYNCTVTFIGAYASNGTKTMQYTINPMGTKLKKLKKAKKAFTVTWSKQKTKMPKQRVTGYQIRYATDGNFATAKYKNVKKYSKTSYKIKKLPNKTKYFVQVRTYMKVGGKVYYSDWSNIKAVTTR